MSIYRCTRCDVIENTALGGYWMQQLEAHKAGTKHEPLCSQCDPSIGEWHGKFPRQGVTPDYVQDARGFLWKPEHAKTVPHLGPFKPITA
jgi:hypothetical protein